MDGLKESSIKCPHGCYVGDKLYCEKCDVRTATLEEVEWMLRIYWNRNGDTFKVFELTNENGDLYTMFGYNRFFASAMGGLWWPIPIEPPKGDE